MNYLEYNETISFSKYKKPSYVKEEDLKKRTVSRQKVAYSLRTGKLKKPERCFLCGNVEKLYAHHENYNYPLNIDWLCLRCHSELHNVARINNGWLYI